MSTALNFDSDWDYHDSLQTLEDQIVSSIEDGEHISYEYIAWMVRNHPCAVDDALMRGEPIDADHFMHEFAKLLIEEQDGV
jgi:hypothetical protein